MLETAATVLITYASLSVFGFGAMAASALTGPARLVVVAVTLMMAAAPYGNLGGPRL